MTTKYFLKNKLNAILSTRDGGLQIPPFGYAQIREVDCENLTVLYCVDRKWAEIVNEEPTEKHVVEEVKPETSDPFKGLTLEELQAEQAAKAEAAEAKEAAKAEEAPAPKASKAKKA